MTVYVLFGAYFNPPRGCMGLPASFPTTPEHMHTHWSAPLHPAVLANPYPVISEHTRHGLKYSGYKFLPCVVATQLYTALLI